jgi:hypothetical protein
MGPDLRGEWLLFMWTRATVKLLINLALISCPFFSGADSKGAEVVTATREGSSPSVGELWLGIEKLDNPSREDTSIVCVCNALIHGKRSAALIKDTNKHSRRDGNRGSLTDVAGTSDFRSKRRRCGSARRKAARILSAALGAISPRMRRSFVDRRYSPLTGMGLSEWKIILDELIHMGCIVKKEPDSDHNG